MTYRDEIVDDVRAIRETICTQAGNLDNLLAMLRSEEVANAGRMAKQPVASDSGNLLVVGSSLLVDRAVCAEPAAKYRTKKRENVRKNKLHV